MIAILIIISIIILAAYLTYACCKVGIPYCLSDTAYTVGKGLFAIAMISIAICLWLPLINVTLDEYRFLVFLAFAGIAILAVSPYKDSVFNYKLHYTGTCIVMAAVLSLWTAKGELVMPIATISLGLTLRDITVKWLLWVELMMFLEIFLYAASPWVIPLLLN